MDLLFENEAARIYFDDSIPGLVQVWDGFVRGELLRTAHEAFVQHQQQFQTSRSLSDLRTMRVISPADQEWIETVFFPQVYAAGYRHVAILASDDIFNQVSVKNILLQVEQGRTFQAQYFDDEQMARAWLAQQQ